MPIKFSKNYMLKSKVYQNNIKNHIELHEDLTIEFWYVKDAMNANWSDC